MSLALLAARAAINHLSVVAFDPSQLYAGGIDGAFFDPSDFSTMFQDTAGTTPVTAAGQSVARINDKSGNGHTATQATSGTRPTIQQDGSGYWYLSFSGSQYLDCGTGFNANTFAMACAYYWTGSGNQRLLDTRGTGALGTVQGWLLKTTDPSGNDGFAADDGVHYVTSNHTSSTSVAHVFYGDFTTNTALRYQLDAGLLTTVSASPVGNTSSAKTSRIGAASNDGSQGLSGRVYGIVVVKSTLTSTQIANLRTWEGAKCGVTL